MTDEKYTIEIYAKLFSEKNRISSLPIKQAIFRANNYFCLKVKNKNHILTFIAFAIYIGAIAFALLPFELLTF